MQNFNINIRDYKGIVMANSNRIDFDAEKNMQVENLKEKFNPYDFENC